MYQSFKLLQTFLGQSVSGKKQFGKINFNLAITFYRTAIYVRERGLLSIWLLATLVLRHSLGGQVRSLLSYQPVTHINTFQDILSDPDVKIIIPAIFMKSHCEYIREHHPKLSVRIKNITGKVLNNDFISHGRQGNVVIIYNSLVGKKFILSNPSKKLRIGNQRYFYSPLTLYVRKNYRYSQHLYQLYV